MGEQDFSTCVEKYVQQVTDDVTNYIKETDEFGRHRHGLLQKESSLSVLTAQRWDVDISQHIDVLKQEVSKEFAKTEDSQKRINQQRESMISTKRSVEETLQKLLGVYQKLQCCLNGGVISEPFDGSSVSGTPDSCSGGYAAYESSASTPLGDNNILQSGVEAPLHSGIRPRPPSVIDRVVTAISTLVPELDLRDQSFRSQKVIDDKKVQEELRTILKEASKSDTKKGIDQFMSNLTGLSGLSGLDGIDKMSSGVFGNHSAAASIN